MYPYVVLYCNFTYYKLFSFTLLYFSNKINVEKNYFGLNVYSFVFDFRVINSMYEYASTKVVFTLRYFILKKKRFLNYFFHMHVNGPYF